MKKPLLSELSLREKIGQMGNYSTPVLTEKMRNGDEDVSLIGSIWALGALNMKVINMADESTGEKIPAKTQWDFINEFNKDKKIPALIAMDSTKGIKSAFYDMSRLVDPPTMGATGYKELAYRLGKAQASELKCAGTKWLWGPEEDIANRNSAVSLGRKFSDNPDLVIKLASAVTKGVQDYGVAATAKHFPGDDEMEYRDSHVSAAMIHIPVDQWKAKQGRVFQGVIDAGVYSVMVGHQSFPAYDNTKIKNKYIPSTVSYKVVTELLKEKMGFKGVVITDAIGMQGLANLFGGDLAKVSVACVKAGCDVILGSPRNFVDVIEQAVLKGEIPESRIDDACQRVLDMKEKIGLFDGPVEEMDHDKVVEESAKLRQDVATKALSLVCDNNKMLPLNPDKIKNITIVYSGFGQGVYESLEIMKDELIKHGAENVTIVNGLYERADAKKYSEQSDLMLYVSHIACHQPRGQAGYQGDEFYTFYHTTEGGQKGKRIGVSLGSPYVHFDYYEDFDCFINAYNPTEETQRAFVKALYGEVPFEGGHPFRIIPDGFDVNY